MSGYRGKRFLDLVLVIGSAPLWLPLMAYVALLVRRGIGSPVLFRQRRTGCGDREFLMMKFRSMTDARTASGAALPEDDRLTPFGRRLRASSLDELPELFNVLRGDMSLVGPRPLLPQYLPRYSTYHRRRHEVRPGLTGLAQVSGRNAIGWSEKFDLDVKYVDACSVWLDIRILWRTIRAVMVRDGIAAAGDAIMPEFTDYGAPATSSSPERAK